ncbi:MAG: DUF1592 domain-containing protein [Gemmataceae bacterium]
MRKWVVERIWNRACRASAEFVVVLAIAVTSCPTVSAAPNGAANFRKTIEPILTEYCSQCHSGDLKKGGVAFDADDAASLLADKELWLKALKMLRAEMMPPKGKRRPSPEQIAQVESWIKYSVFEIDPRDPDPGRVVLRRLNRTEYRNTIRELMGVDFNAFAEFPADDTGHGFDTIGDVLSISPLLLEKYISAAKAIVAQTVPLQSGVPAEKRIAGQRFAPTDSNSFRPADGPLALSYYKPAKVTYSHAAEHAGRYQVVLDLTASETFVDGQFDYNKCRLLFKCGDRVLLTREFNRQGSKAYRFEFEQDWKAGKQELTLEIQPLTPKEKQVRSLTLRLNEVTIRGPMAKEHWGRSARYEKYFPGSVPQDPEQRRAYAIKILEPFVTRAYRRPADRESMARLVHLVEATAAKPGRTFEEGMAQAMTVVLASPRFLFREEEATPNSTDRYPLLDEYALASRLSYFLWSSMPDEELFQLAAQNKLRQNLSSQVTRMLADKRSGELIRNFAGQWLQARGIDSVNVNAAAVLLKEQPQDPVAEKQRARFRELIRKPRETLTDAEKKELEKARSTFFRGFRRFAQFALNGELRRAMRQETEMTFEYIVRDDRSLLELLDANYTFLNERLAKVYGIEGVTGAQMRKVTLPPNSPRGGILTQATFLIITSNPDRTSPVKRGLFILDNLLGVPPPPPPPDITPLEEAADKVKGKPPTLREALKVHRSEALCSSCHNRMDPLGLAFENFNALGRWRDKELNQPIEAGGQLLTGESFKDVRELKKILTTTRRFDYYRCAAEKMLIYALGRGLEPSDAHTVDELVGKLEAAQGRPSVLIRGIIDAPAFQRRRVKSNFS